MPHRLPRRGLTLMEMVIVVALIVIIAALTIPSLQDMYGNYVQESAADAVRAAWVEAKARAVNEGRPYRFAIVPGQGNFRVAPDSGEFWSGETPQAVEGSSAWLLQDALPRGIRFGEPNAAIQEMSNESGETSLPIESVSPDMWLPVVNFLPDNTADRDVELTFQSRVASPLVVKLRAVTGSVTSFRLRPDGTRPVSSPGQP